jgi:sulfite reductase alpha subunit-like flavoprotein
MASSHPAEPHHPLPETSTSHPSNPIPEVPTDIPHVHSDVHASDVPTLSVTRHDASASSSDSEPKTPESGYTEFKDVFDQLKEDRTVSFAPSPSPLPKKRRASTVLLASSPAEVEKILGDGKGGTKLLEKVCCGGGCCLSGLPKAKSDAVPSKPITLPDNDAFRSLELKLGPLGLDTELTQTIDLPEETVSFTALPRTTDSRRQNTHQQPPSFLKPHAPYDVYLAKVYHARELTKPGAEKRTYHFDLDVTDYPAESGDVDFMVGGAIGICAPNSDQMVDEIFDLLGIPYHVRDKEVILHTKNGRWPTIWGDEMPRELYTTRRELLTWCSDIQSYAPTKPLLRVLAEYAEDPNEKKILLYLSSAEGQGAFCDLRTGPFITLSQLLSAFPSSQPPLPHLLSSLNTLMPRFYSLSQDPQVECSRQGADCHRLIEVAVTIHELPNCRGGTRTGLGSGYLERVAQQFIDAERMGINTADLDIRVPMFRGLMANPLAREFVTDGPMLLIGAGVGIAPFRGFVQRRLKSANCANKVWVLQGIRDSLVDELYSGEWGVEDSQVKKVVESRRGEGKYVQEEVRNQADLVWFVANAVDGRVCVCGSSKGMGEGVEEALVEVAMEKGGLNKHDAEQFWKQKKGGGQYIAVCEPG